MVCIRQVLLNNCVADHANIGTRVPGTNYQLDPVRGAFNIGAIIRWLDFNDCFLAAECGHFVYFYRIKLMRLY